MHIRPANEQDVQLNQYQTNVRIETEHIWAMNEQSVQIIQHQIKGAWKRTTYGLQMSRVSESVCVRPKGHQKYIRSVGGKASDSVSIRPRERWNNTCADCGRAAYETWSASGRVGIEKKVRTSCWKAKHPTWSESGEGSIKTKHLQSVGE